MFDNNNSDNGQRRLRFNFGKKFKRKPYNHELSEQENMMNLINDYRQWQQDNPQPDCSNMSTREVLEAIVSDFRAQQREEEEAKKAAQMQAPYGSAQTSYVPTQGSYGTTEQIGATANPYLEFDGEQLSWYENNQKKKSWKAMSGKPKYQCSEYQSRPYGGPIPEGSWQVKQSNYQNFNDLPILDRAISQAGAYVKSMKLVGKWPGGTESWGTHRIWLEPDTRTNTYNRSRVTIHGGNDFGSAGCIDLADGMDDFAQDYKKYGKDMPLTVKYPKKCW